MHFLTMDIKFVISGKFFYFYFEQIVVNTNRGKPIIYWSWLNFTRSTSYWNVLVRLFVNFEWFFFLKIFFVTYRFIHRITSFPFENVSRDIIVEQKKIMQILQFLFLFWKEKHIKLKRQTNFLIFPYYNFNVVKKKKTLYKINCTEKSLRTEMVSLLASCNISTLFLI